MADKNEAVFHVTCVYADKPHEERKKKLSLIDKGVYRDALLSMFGLHSEGEYIFQQFDADFSDWIDIDDPLQLPDIGRLKITVCSGQLYFLLSMLCMFCSSLLVFLRVLCVYLISTMYWLDTGQFVNSICTS